MRPLTGAPMRPTAREQMPWLQLAAWSVCLLATARASGDVFLAGEAVPVPVLSSNAADVQLADRRDVTLATVWRSLESLAGAADRFVASVDGVSQRVAVLLCQSSPCMYGGSCRALARNTSVPNLAVVCDCAVGFSGDRCESVSVNVSTADPVMLRAAPFRNGSFAGANLTWTSNVTFSGLVYRVLYSQGATAPRQCSGNVTAASIVVPGLQRHAAIDRLLANTFYSFRVCACLGANCSSGRTVMNMPHYANGALCSLSPASGFRGVCATNSGAGSITASAMISNLASAFSCSSGSGNGRSAYEGPVGIALRHGLPTTAVWNMIVARNVPMFLTGTVVQSNTGFTRSATSLNGCGTVSYTDTAPSQRTTISRIVYFNGIDWMSVVPGTQLLTVFYPP